MKQPSYPITNSNIYKDDFSIDAWVNSVELKKSKGINSGKSLFLYESINLLKPVKEK